MSRDRALYLAVGIGGFSFGLGAESIAFGWNEFGKWVPDLVVGWTFIGCGVLALQHRAGSLNGPLLTASGFAWFLGTISSYALFLHRGPLIHALLSFPHGRPNSTFDRISIVAGYITAFIPVAGRNEPVVIALAALVISSALRGVGASVGPERRARRAALPAAIILGIVLAGSAVTRRVTTPETSGDVLLAIYQLALVAIAVYLLVQLLYGAWERVAVTDLVVGLQEAPINTVRDALARALGDPSLQIGFRAGSERYVDESGAQIEVPQEGADRAVTHVELDGRSVAILVHDRSILQDPGLLDSIAAAARLTAANVRLRSEVRAQIDELRSSRRRFLQAGERERRRLEQRLRAGAGQHLRSLGDDLERLHIRAAQTDVRGLADAIREAEVRLTAALDDLAELARGLHPSALTTSGLAGAVTKLCDSAPVTVDVDVSAQNVPDDVATIAYYICSEALANVAKHARAERCIVRIERLRANLMVEITDDGVGGAAPSKGTGLQGLSDRAEAVGGTVRVESPAGGGTRITADLPLGGDARSLPGTTSGGSRGLP